MQKTINILQQLIKQFIADNCSSRAAALVYTTLLSMVPLAIVGFAAISMIPWFAGTTPKLESFIVQHFVDQSAQSLIVQLQGFVHQATHYSAWSFLFFTVTSVLLIYNINEAFNAIWETHARRNYVLLFFIYLLAVLIGPVLLALVVFLSTFLLALPWISVLDQFAWLHSAALLLLPHALLFLSFSLMNKLLPACYVPWRAAWLGGLVSTILFDLLRVGFAVYMQHATTYKILYGALAAIPAFLVWLYLAWSIVLLGAQVARLVSKRLY